MKSEALRQLNTLSSCQTQWLIGLQALSWATKPGFQAIHCPAVPTTLSLAIAATDIWGPTACFTATGPLLLFIPCLFLGSPQPQYQLHITLQTRETAENPFLS